MPVAPSSKRYVPKMLGRFRAPLSGKTETTFTPRKPSRGCAAPGRHQEQRPCAPVPLDLVVAAARDDGLAAEGLGERVERAKGKSAPVDLGVDTSRHRAVAAESARAGSRQAGGRPAPQPLGFRAQLPDLPSDWRRAPCGARPARARSNAADDDARARGAGEQHGIERHGRASESGAAGENGSKRQQSRRSRFATASSTTAIATGSRKSSLQEAAIAFPPSAAAGSALALFVSTALRRWRISLPVLNTGITFSSTARLAGARIRPVRASRRFTGKPQSRAAPPGRRGTARRRWCRGWR